MLYREQMKALLKTVLFLPALVVVVCLSLVLWVFDLRPPYDIPDVPLTRKPRLHARRLSPAMLAYSCIALAIAGFLLRWLLL